eukprot:CAMPEP_0185753062 /NCGR_PEP_ID=MMETSP1174-20130828/11813_1 /TAXON_ID=35687 /ORGANISM="Dictyocha speculum, Strain CCMP1381" /LENGTH=293 /DNA_ID=CAMNT_0028430753 /DNA_START=21 /DNA_END=902 /DNA_ORIENTATION=-
MAVPALPASFKPIKPYLMRADELDKDNTREESKIVAYFCRQYAMERGLELRGSDNSKATTDYLMALMGQLETAKNQMSVPPTKEAGKTVVTKFALDVFARADEEDRAERANKGTARTFYAAGIFLETLKQFGELGSDIEEKKMYSKWKSAEILKAIKEGRPIRPGGPNEELPPVVDDVPEAPSNFPAPSTFGNSGGGGGAEQDSTTTTSSSYQEPAPRATNSSPTAPPPYVAPATAPAASRGNRPDGRGGSGGRNKDQIDDAIELAKFAIRALEHKEIDLACERLQSALSRLR